MDYRDRTIRIDSGILGKLQIYSSLNEAQLKHYYEPQEGLFIAETENVILRAIHGGYRAESLLIDEKLLAEFSSDTLKEILKLTGDVPVYTGSMETLSGISGFKQTRGVLAAMRRKKLPDAEEIIRDASVIAVLENIENPTNIGAIFRSAAALSVDAVLLTFRCADPLYRRAARVSMGTVFQVPWTFIGDKNGGWPDPGIRKLHENGFSLFSMALSDRSVSIADPVLKTLPKRAILLGNEENGLLPETIEASDHTVRIPMSHGVDSLNVAAAAAVTFWELAKH